MNGLWNVLNPGEVIHALAASAAILALIGLAEAWRAWSAPPVEWTRKLVHCGAGLCALPFPWLFNSPWTVLALGAAFAAFLRVTRRCGLLRSIHGTARSTDGDLYYLAGLFLLFLVGRDRHLFYGISLLVLVVSDTLAALIGSAYGRWTYGVGTGCRTVEGSAAFFLSTLLCVGLPLLVFTPLGPVAAVLIAVQTALVATLLEAVSLHGSDNLVAPLGTFCLLVALVPCTPDQVALLILAELAVLAPAALFAGQQARSAGGRR